MKSFFMKDVIMNERVENQVPNKWIFEVLDDIRRFCEKNELKELASELQKIKTKHYLNVVQNANDQKSIHVADL